MVYSHILKIPNKRSIEIKKLLTERALKFITLEVEYDFQHLIPELAWLCYSVHI